MMLKKCYINLPLVVCDLNMMATGTGPVEYYAQVYVCGFVHMNIMLGCNEIVNSASTSETKCGQITP